MDSLSHEVLNAIDRVLFHSVAVARLQIQSKVSYHRCFLCLDRRDPQRRHGGPYKLISLKSTHKAAEVCLR